jgi:acetyltransferase-like isoleucine patch superfamily enzyme
LKLLRNPLKIRENWFFYKMISNNAKIYGRVELGQGISIGDFAVIGLPPKLDGSQSMTKIGDNSLIRSHTVIYAGNIIGKNFQTGHHANIREDNMIGDNVSIGTMSVVEHHVTIEDSVRIHTQSFIPEYSILKKDAWIGPRVVLTNAKFPRSKTAKNNLKGVIIGEKAVIGANSTILPGIRIGKNALIGAGSVVTKDVPDNKVIVGNPGRIIKDISDLHYIGCEEKVY